MICDNAYNSGSIVPGGCCSQQATKTVKIIYNEVEYDTLKLCNLCCKLISKDAKKHGYLVEIKEL